MQTRYWHVVVCAIVATVIFGLADFFYLKHVGELPSLRTIWWLSVLVPMLCGSIVTLGCGGASLGARIIGAAACGVMVGLLYTGVSAKLGHNGAISIGEIVANGLLRRFIFSMFSTFGAIFTELKWADPELK
jgi:hypothetical protein